MDGTIADWNGGVLKLFKKDKDVYKNWTPGNSHIETAINKTREEVNDAINKAGKDFWANLEPYPWSQKLFSECRKITRTCILSDPGRFYRSVEGKIEWLQKNLSKYNLRGKGFEDFLFGPNKDFAASSDAILIDDNEKKIDDFIKAGGKGIIFPRIWNRNHQYSKDPLSYTLIALRQFKDN